MNSKNIQYDRIHSLIISLLLIFFLSPVSTVWGCITSDQEFSDKEFSTGKAFKKSDLVVYGTVLGKKTELKGNSMFDKHFGKGKSTYRIDVKDVKKSSSDVPSKIIAISGEHLYNSCGHDPPPKYGTDNSYTFFLKKDSKDQFVIFRQAPGRKGNLYIWWIIYKRIISKSPFYAPFSYLPSIYSTVLEIYKNIYF